MKRVLWLFSAIGLTMIQANTATANSGRIYISSGDRQLNVEVETPVLSDSELDAAINELAASSQSLNQNINFATSYNHYAQPVQAQPETFSIKSYSGTKSNKLSSQAAPSIAARIASGAAHSRSIGRCALYVRKALQAAGYNFTPQPSAYQYANGTLQSAGFVRLSNDGYVPQVGDVAVFNRTAKNPHGHIQIYNGSMWVSDFNQPKFSPYSQHGGYSVWRDARYLDASNNQGTYLAYNE